MPVGTALVVGWTESNRCVTGCDPRDLVLLPCYGDSHEHISVIPSKELILCWENIYSDLFLDPWPYFFPHPLKHLLCSSSSLSFKLQYQTHQQILWASQLKHFSNLLIGPQPPFSALPSVMEQGTFLGTWRLHLPTCLAAGRGHLNVGRCSMNPWASGSVMTTVGQTGPPSSGSHFCHHPEHTPVATCLQTNNRTNVCLHFPHLCPLRGGATLSPVQANPLLCSWFYTLFIHLRCCAMNYFLDSSFFPPYCLFS